jgi:hypothetical protein
MQDLKQKHHPWIGKTQSFYSQTTSVKLLLSMRADIFSQSQIKIAPVRNMIWKKILGVLQRSINCWWNMPKCMLLAQYFWYFMYFFLINWTMCYVFQSIAVKTNLHRHDRWPNCLKFQKPTGILWILAIAVHSTSMHQFISIFDQW